MIQKADKWMHAMGTELWSRLADSDKALLARLGTDYGMTFQQLRQLGHWMLDCRMWEETSFWNELEEMEAHLGDALPNLPQKRKRLFAHLQQVYATLRGKAKHYDAQGRREALPRYRIERKELTGRIFKLCPAASEKAVCCNLKVLNIVDNCAMACSYCVLQSHFEEPSIKLPANLEEKLAEISLDPQKRYRVGTGEYSDSLLWGNAHGLLDHLLAFAERHPNIILELKTKSANIGHLLKVDLPSNLCCSWSLNPQVVIDHEEHKTASLEKRLESARRIADKGGRVGFHLHPMMYFDGWENAYGELIERVISQFASEEVLWFSLGTVTLLSSTMPQIRLNYRNSKLLQMDLEKTPDNKWTYPYSVRSNLYRNALEKLEPWKGKVFQYLCMEHRPLWEDVMGFAYPNMAVFDDALNDSAFAKLGPGRA